MPLKQYLIELGKNSKAFNAFKANPERAMTDAGLSPAERNAVLSGDMARIRRALGARADDDIIVVVTVVITVVA
jgi:hypothetical protein